MRPARNNEVSRTAPPAWRNLVVRGVPGSLPMSKPLTPTSAPPGGSTTSADAVLRLVRARGGRVTLSRRTLLEVLFEAAGHMSAEELAEAVQERLAGGPHLDHLPKPG